MKFHIQYPNGSAHEIELEGTVAVLGREPSCDLVLNDSKCSRRHAVIEAGVQGITIRDSGSANGVFVNGKKVDRAQLNVGDVVRLGDVQVTILKEDVPGTVVMGPEEVDDVVVISDEFDLPLAPPPPPPPRPPTPRPVSPARPAPAPEPPRPIPPPQPKPMPRTPPAPRPEPRLRPEVRPLPISLPIERPITVTILGLLWAMSALLYCAGALASSRFLEGRVAVATGIVGLMFALVSSVMAFGLLARAGWARFLQIALAVIGILNCPFSVACIAVIIYMLRPATRIVFSGRRSTGELTAPEQETLRAETADGVFAGAIAGAVFLGVAASIAIGVLLPRAGFQFPSAVGAGAPRALAQMRRMAQAQQAFQQVCNSGYADLDGLISPGTVIPALKAGPAFLQSEFAQAVRDGYRFELSVEGELPSAEGCPSRRFRSYRYAASPLDGAGRHFVLASDGIVRMAEGRAATEIDSPAE